MSCPLFDVPIQSSWGVTDLTDWSVFAFGGLASRVRVGRLHQSDAGDLPFRARLSWAVLSSPRAWGWVVVRYEDGHPGREAKEGRERGNRNKRWLARGDERRMDGGGGVGERHGRIRNESRIRYHAYIHRISDIPRALQTASPGGYIQMLRPYPAPPPATPNAPQRPSSPLQKHAPTAPGHGSAGCTTPYPYLTLPYHPAPCPYHPVP